MACSCLFNGPGGEVMSLTGLLFVDTCRIRPTGLGVRGCIDVQLGYLLREEHRGDGIDS